MSSLEQRLLLFARGVNVPQLSAQRVAPLLANQGSLTSQNNSNVPQNKGYKTVAAPQKAVILPSRLIEIFVHCLVTVQETQLMRTLSHLANHEVFKQFLSHFAIGSRRTKGMEFVVTLKPRKRSNSSCNNAG